MRIPPKNLLLFLWLLVYRPAASQEPDPEFRLLQQLDSVAKSPSPARYFAVLYLETTGRAIAFYQEARPAEKEFIERLELNFAGYFFRAATQPPGELSQVWKPYFSDSSLSAFQYQLLGINAHINGDIWQALVTGFTPEELRVHRRHFTRFQQGLKKQFCQFYWDNVNTTPVTRLLHAGTGGLSRIFGIMMLSRWRKRQYRLARFYYSDPGKFSRLLQKITRKKERLDRLVFRHL